MKYYLLQHADDGGYHINVFGTKQELLREIKDSNEGVAPAFQWRFATCLEDFMNGVNGSNETTVLILDAEVVVPKPVKVVEEYEID